PWIHVHAEDFLPDNRPAGQRRVSSHRLDEAHLGKNDQAKEAEEDETHDEEVHRRRPESQPAQAGEPDQASPYEETAEGGGGIGHREEPERHRQNRAVSDQRSCPAGGLSSPERLKKTPQGSESEDQADDAETVLIARNAAVVRDAGPDIEGPPHLGVVLDKEDGEGDQEKTCSREEPLYGGGRVGLGHDDQDHHDVPNGLDPPLEGDVWVVGPEDAHGGVKEE